MALGGLVTGHQVMGKQKSDIRMKMMGYPSPAVGFRLQAVSDYGRLNANGII